MCSENDTYVLPLVDHILAQLAEAQFFTKLDANSGFWQVPLSKDSAYLTTFITPYGRFCFNRLPFGISSAPELFQRRMSIALNDLEGVTCLMDDILIHPADFNTRQITEPWHYSEQREVFICHKFSEVSRSHCWKRGSKTRPRESARH